MIYPEEAQAKRDILEVGRRMYSGGFVAANDGNISARVGENVVWATPTNVSKGFMSEDMLVKLDLDGNVLEGTYKPSSEVKLHLAVYRNDPGILGVVHAHPPIATAFAAAGIPLDEALLQETVVMLGVVPVAPYTCPGSRELAESAASYVKEYNAVLLEHHGAVTWGDSVMRAYFRLESVEYYAKMMMNSRLMGVTRPMTEEQIDELLTLRPGWGVDRGGRPRGRSK